MSEELRLLELFAEKDRAEENFDLLVKGLENGEKIYHEVLAESMSRLNFIDMEILKICSPKKDPNDWLEIDIEKFVNILEKYL